VKPVRARTFLATLSALVVVAGMLFGANVASADSVQYQSYGRVSQSEACAAQVGETPWQASWGTDSSWYPSWEQCGGTVFYIDMARAAGSQVWEVGSDLGTAGWGCSATDIGVTGTAIGTGATNTGLINAGCLTAGIAARVASATAGGLSDWFLPSKDELNQLCKYARMQSTAVVDQAVVCDATGTLRSGFASFYYWSSSQYDSNYAWGQYFVDGFQLTAGKNDLLQVRPVRAF
jgi:hypothetical protein